MTIFIKHPPAGDQELLAPKGWNPVAYTLVDHFRIEVHLSVLREMFLNTGNALHALEAFHLARVAGVYPPLWVIEFLDDRFVRAQTADVSIDRALGLNTEGMGKGRRRTAKEEVSLASRNFMMSVAVMKLEHAGLTRQQACRALSSLLARLAPGQAVNVLQRPRSGGLRQMEITAQGIRKAIDAHDLDKAEDMAWMRSRLIEWSDDDRRAFLTGFYRTELPAAVVRALGI